MVTADIYPEVGDVCSTRDAALSLDEAARVVGEEECGSEGPACLFV